MRALTFWKTVVADKVDFLGRLIALLAEHRIQYCVISGVAVNAYVEPVITLDLNLVIAADQIAEAEIMLRHEFVVERLSHSLNVSSPGSNLRVQIQLDPRYSSFVERAVTRGVLGLDLPVAVLDDLLQGTLWAVSDPARPRSKRHIDLFDITRLVEAYPHLRERLPAEILARIY